MADRKKIDYFFETDRVKSYEYVGKDGKTKIRLKWNKEQLTNRNENYKLAQQYIDSEILRLCEPYVPYLTGVLDKSSIWSTVIGSGEVDWNTPYAHRQYYSKSAVGRETGPLRGPMWFERMKQARGQEIIKVAKRIAGKG